MPDILIRILKSLFDENRADVAVDGNQSDFFPLLSGVLQGIYLSPILYTLFIDRGSDHRLITGTIHYSSYCRTSRWN
jgi:hypothetical protein